eukprot:5167725-Amphidinium_carterae.2
MERTSDWRAAWIVLVSARALPWRRFPFCCGYLDKLRAEATNAATRLGPDCRGDHNALTALAEIQLTRGVRISNPYK